MKSLCVLLLIGVVYCNAFAPLLSSDSKTAIPGEYIIVFHDNITERQSEEHLKKLSGDAPFEIMGIFSIGDSFKGFSAKLSPSLLMRERLSDDVKYVEFNQEVHVSQSCTQQTGAVWGLDRITERALDLDGRYTYTSTAGSGVDAYIIDTGIYIKHNEFGGRALWGGNFVDSNNDDCNGHGTHVAGTVGGTTYGVAKKTTLIAVKVLNCQGSGSTAGVINGVNFATQQYQARKKPSVANMSLGGGKSTAMDDAIKSSIAAGLTYAVAAGNENQDACNVSPANVATAITVGATTIDDVSSQEVDARSSFSNYGTCVSIFAPGELIQSAWIGSVSATKTITGTSMASPHACGTAALYLAANPTAKPATVKAFLSSESSLNLITLNCVGTTSSCKNSPNKLLYSPC